MGASRLSPSRQSCRRACPRRPQQLSSTRSPAHVGLTLLHCLVLEVVRFVDVDPWSRIGDLRMCVSAARQGTRACWRSLSAVRSRSERSQRGRDRWGGPHGAIPVFTPFFQRRGPNKGVWQPDRRPGWQGVGSWRGECSWNIGPKNFIFVFRFFFWRRSEKKKFKSKMEFCWNFVP